MEVPSGYDLAGSLRSLRTGGLDPCWRLTRDAVAFAAWMPEGPGTLALQATAGRVVARAWGPGARALVEATPALLGAHDDPSTFRPTHPTLRALHARAAGVRLAVHPSVGDGLVAIVLQQRVTWEDAARSWGHLARTWGRLAPGPLALQTPADPEVLARQPYEALHPLGVEARRAVLVREVARRHQGLHRLATTRDALAVVAHLATLPGFGPWTRGHAAGQLLGHADAVPLGDVHLPRHISWLLEGREEADDARLLELLAPYRPHRYRVIRLAILGGPTPPRRSHVRGQRWRQDL